MKALDLFAGPGGWDEGLRPLGIEPLGIEWDDNACATRRAAGHPTLQADVAALEPSDFAGTELLLASPPCQAFSVAGKRKGELDRSLILAVMARLALGQDDRAEAAAKCADARSLLTVEPLRFALALRPRFIAFEQVPGVLPLWEETAIILSVHGYATWTGKVYAEEYGVPQTRRRAILLASLDGPVAPPTPTHHRYDPRDVDAGRVASGGRLPWVSMAAALGWPPTDIVGFPRRADTVSNRAGDAVLIDGVRYRSRDLRLADEPAFNLTEKGRSWARYDGADVVFVSDAQRNATRRPLSAPAPTIKGGHGRAYFEAPVSADPLGLKGEDWPWRRPATTIAGDARVFQPGGHHARGEQSRNAIRVTVEEAAVLQSFPADYPWQGSRSAQFLQVGNAVPPLLARAIVGALVGASPPKEHPA